MSITELRVGSAKAVADLLILNPATWSACRRAKDELQRYLTQPDPNVGEANSAWGVPVLSTTQLTPGVGVLVDTTKAGRIWQREGLSVRTGFAGTDFTDNVVRFVAEERLGCAVERPAAICVITGLPTGIPGC